MTDRLQQAAEAIVRERLGLRDDVCSKDVRRMWSVSFGCALAGLTAGIAMGLEMAAELCDFAGNGTVEKMSEDGRSETWKVIAENSVEQYRSLSGKFLALAKGETQHG